MYGYLPKARLTKEYCSHILVGRDDLDGSRCHSCKSPTPYFWREGISKQDICGVDPLGASGSSDSDSSDSDNSDSDSSEED